VKPVEDWPIFAVWLAAKQRDEWLQKATTFTHTVPGAANKVAP